MHRNTRRVVEALRSLSSDARVVEVAETTRTAREAAEAIGTTVAQIAKSLVFTCGDDPVLVVASGVNRVSTDKVSVLLGGPIARADADTVRRATGFPIGGVPPLGLATELPVLIDEDLLGYEEVWAAAGTPNAVFQTTPDELIRITGGTVADVKS